MAAKPKPVCQSLLPWLKANLGDHCLAPLTGQDARALAAAVHIIELYSIDWDQSVLEAFGLIVSRMQSSTRELAYHAIAHVIDWSDRGTVWAMAQLPYLDSVRKCKFE